ncbi:MAG: ABC transporter permease [Dehalococcoidia bacterium]|nr:ABC transporter permease [Dehalococcoidia bacterium]MCB9484490.1 ABC transporter permease [Thermoflexaceae bacterium]
MAVAGQQEIAFPSPQGRNPLRAFVKFARAQPLATFGLLALVVFLFIAAFAPMLTPQDAYQTSVRDALSKPGSEHWFGTDNLGRDVFSRVLLATRFSLFLGAAATVFAIAIYSVLGLVSGYVGGMIDTFLQRLVDAAMAIPFLLFLLLVVTMLGPGFLTIAFVIGLYNGVTNSRVIRGSVLSVKREVYVEAARSVGVPPWRIVVRHVLPNIMATIIIIASLSLGSSILAESSLSFLGYGVPPPDPTWGQMMGAEARPYVTRGPWMAIFPGIALSIVVFSINVLGDGLRDALDPRLRNR